LGQFGIRRFGLEQGLILRPVGDGFQIRLSLRHQCFQPGVLLPQLLRALRIIEDLRVAQGGFDFPVAAGELFDLWA